MLRLWTEEVARLTRTDHKQSTEGWLVSEGSTSHAPASSPPMAGGSVFCIVTYDGNVGRALAYLNPGQFPEFDGEEAWFRVRWHSKLRRDFLEQIEAPT